MHRLQNFSARMNRMFSAARPFDARRQATTSSALVELSDDELARISGGGGMPLDGDPAGPAS